MDVETGASPRKRARLDGPPTTGVCTRFASSYATHMRARIYASAFSATGLSIGSRIQVLWSVQRTGEDADAEAEEEDVWWSCSVEAETTHGPGGRPAHRLRYDPSDELGFDEETRVVAFLGGGCGAVAEGEAGGYTLLDLQDGAPMPWRLEDGEEEEEEEEHPPGVIPPGTKVKARFQGGAKAYAGEVYRVRYDSPEGPMGADAEPRSDGGSAGAQRVLYDILYEDRVLEEGVPADLVERATRAPAPSSPAFGSGSAASRSGGGSESAGGGEDIAATSIDGFFAAFVTGLMNGKTFSGLSADKKAAFAECVQRSRPHFEAELHNLASDRGYGTTVTADDITQLILPRVLPQVVSEFKALAAR